jgi:hypothetical protein
MTSAQVVPMAPMSPETQTLLRNCCVTGLLSTVFVLLRFLHYSLTITQEPNPDGVFHHPYRHPAIQKAINITWFRTVIDVGFDFKKHFSPLPVPAIAYILAAVRAVSDFDSHMFSRAG